MTQPLLSIRNVEKQYGSTRALKGVSFDLYPGEVVGLLGVNGAGKTTLSTIIATLHPTTKGDILFGNTSIYNDITKYRKQIGYCPQKPNLNPMLTVKQNLEFAAKYYGMSDEAIQKRLAQLDNYLGISQYLHAKPDELSGGWKQRYMIARTLMHSPKLIILDEPTVALDPAIRNQLWYYIEQIKAQGICILLTTHYLEEAEKLSDRVMLLAAGEIKLIDTPENLMHTFQMGRLEDVFLELTQEPKD